MEKQMCFWDENGLPESVYRGAETLGELIGNAREYRKKHGEKDLTQTGLAKLVRLHVSTIARIETDRLMPDVDNLYVLCYVLGIDASRVTLRMIERSRKSIRSA